MEGRDSKGGKKKKKKRSDSLHADFPWYYRSNVSQNAVFCLCTDPTESDILVA